MEEDPLIEVGERDVGTEAYGFPEPPHRDSLLQFTRDVIHLDDPDEQIKVGNVTKEELGRPTATMRALLNIAAYADEEGHTIVANFLRAEAGVTAASGLSKDAKMVSLPFTQRRESTNFGTPRKTTVRAWHGGEKTVMEGAYNG